MRVRPWWLLLGAAGATSALVAVACLDGGRASLTILPDGAPSGGDDGPGTGGDAAEELVVSSICGDAPYVDVGLLIVGVTVTDPDGSPLPGATLTSPLCPRVVQYSDDAGNIAAQISRDTPFYARLTACDYVSMLAPEEEFDADVSSIRVSMLPLLFEDFVPGFDAAAPTIAVAVQHNGGSGACDELDGVTLSVEGDPGAAVTYFSSSTIPEPIDGGTATSTRGLAVITGLQSASYVHLLGTKTGCAVTFTKGTLTGRVPLEPGYVSIMPAYLGDPSD